MINGQLKVMKVTWYIYSSTVLKLQISEIYTFFYYYYIVYKVAQPSITLKCCLNFNKSVKISQYYNIYDYLKLTWAILLHE